LKVMAGIDSHDSTSSPVPVPDYTALMNDMPRLRVGVPKEYFGKGIDPEVASSIQSALDWMKGTGKVELKSISLPHTDSAIAVYYIVATAEASSNLSRFDGVKYGFRAAGKRPLRAMYGRTREEGFGPEVKRRIMLGTFALSSGYYDAYYLQASRVRNLIALDFKKAFEEVDLICTPTSPTPAFKLGEKWMILVHVFVRHLHRYTQSCRVAGYIGSLRLQYIEAPDRVANHWKLYG
jgi:aspartyl-tRNA(Asn)/glutamyl-tRNA(Gln) amidotransferase subunit A